MSIRNLLRKGVLESWCRVDSRRCPSALGCELECQRGKQLKEAFDVIFNNMDDNGDPVGAQPETSWEKGYCAGLRYAYRVLKQCGVELPSSTPQNCLGEKP